MGNKNSFVSREITKSAPSSHQSKEELVVSLKQFLKRVVRRHRTEFSSNKDKYEVVPPIIAESPKLISVQNKKKSIAQKLSPQQANLSPDVSTLSNVNYFYIHQAYLEDYEQVFKLKKSFFLLDLSEESLHVAFIDKNVKSSTIPIYNFQLVYCKVKEMTYYSDEFSNLERKSHRPQIESFFQNSQLSPQLVLDFLEYLFVTKFKCDCYCEIPFVISHSHSIPKEFVDLCKGFFASKLHVYSMTTIPRSILSSFTEYHSSALIIYIGMHHTEVCCILDGEINESSVIISPFVCKNRIIEYFKQHFEEVSKWNSVVHECLFDQLIKQICICKLPKEYIAHHKLDAAQQTTLEQSLQERYDTKKVHLEASILQELYNVDLEIQDQQLFSKSLEETLWHKSEGLLECVEKSLLKLDSDEDRQQACDFIAVVSEQNYEDSSTDKSIWQSIPNFKQFLEFSLYEMLEDYKAVHFLDVNTSLLQGSSHMLAYL